MQMAKVVGTVVSSQKDASLVGHKLLIVRIFREDLETLGEARIVVDTVGAGVGETVLCVQGAASRNAVGDGEAALDAAIIGIVDNVDSVGL